MKKYAFVIAAAVGAAAVALIVFGAVDVGGGNNHTLAKTVIAVEAIYFGLALLIGAVLIVTEKQG